MDLPFCFTEKIEATKPELSTFLPFICTLKAVSVFLLGIQSLFVRWCLCSDEGHVHGTSHWGKKEETETALLWATAFLLLLPVTCHSFSSQPSFISVMCVLYFFSFPLSKPLFFLLLCPLNCLKLVIIVQLSNATDSWGPYFIPPVHRYWNYCFLPLPSTLRLLLSLCTFLGGPYQHSGHQLSLCGW